MTKIASYESEPYLRELTTEVVALFDDNWAALADTIFYPEGGGQPADRGWINDVEVLDVQRREGRVLHLLASPTALGPAHLKLDWGRRFDHMQQHTGQHLLTAVAANRFGWSTTAFHLGESVCDIEVDVPSAAEDQLEELEEAIAAEIRRARPVTVRRVSPRDFPRLEARSRGLPKGHEGSIRLVEIEGLDLNTCGGTHLRSTAELESLKILGSESMRGGTRLYYLAGRRLRRRLSGHEARGARLRILLGTSDEALAETVESKLDQLKEALRRARRFEDSWADAEAERLANRSEMLVTEHYQQVEMTSLQKIARRAGAALVFLTASTSGQEGFFVLAAKPDSAIDLTTVGPQIARLLEGRGGGSGDVFQGRARAVGKRGEAVDLLKKIVS